MPRRRSGDGPKLVSEVPAFADGEVERRGPVPPEQAGNAGLIVRVGGPGVGADAFHGYEISLETSGTLVLGRHRRNWEPIRRVPARCRSTAGSTSVAMIGDRLEVMVDGQSKLIFQDTDIPWPSAGSA